MDTNESITKEKLWSNRIRDFRESGLTRKEWCYQNQLPLSTLSYWIRKLNPGRSGSEEQQEPVFARLPSERCTSPEKTAGCYSSEWTEL